MKCINNLTGHFQYGEASIAAYGVTAGVAIVFTIVCFDLRSKGHSDGSYNHDYDKITTDDAHVHHD